MNNNTKLTTGFYEINAKFGKSEGNMNQAYSTANKSVNTVVIRT
jgi:hypothetical protein